MKHVMAENGRSGGGPGYAKVALPLPVRQEFDYGIPACLGGRVSAGERVRVPFGRRHLVGYCVGLAEESDIPPARIRYIEELLDPAPVVGPDLLALTRWMADYYACSWGEALAAALPAGVGNPAARRPRTAVLLAAGEAAAAKALEEAGERRPEQARVLRVLAAGGEGLSPAELARRARTTTSPIRTLARAGMLVLEELDADDDPFAGVPAAPDTPPELTADQARALASLAGAIERREFRVELLWGVTGSGKTEVYLRAIEP
ncbi:MAG: primosomal protein N', partial [Planctomycetes bacterium]|nr:primosomal protein N' [Planctomycetota bacterium]